MDKSLRILHLEDEPDIVELAKALLERDGLAADLVLVGDMAGFNAALEEDGFDLILADYRLPTCTGIDALREARRRCPGTPFLLFSGTIGEQAAVDALRYGATDYVLKQSPDRLGPAVRRAVREAENQRARQQAEVELRQAQKMEIVGQLAGGVAHDFNNMLAVIGGNAELLLLLKEPELSAKARENVTQIAAAAERAANLTRQLLILSRKHEMQLQTVALNDLIGNLTKLLKRVVREDVRMECRCAAVLPLLQADPGMLEQVLLNLVVNARDAMPEGGHLLITTETIKVNEAHAKTNREARAGEFVCLTVSDTGTGIAAAHLPRIFEPFFTTKEVGQGTGLGLATVYGIVKQHRGWIEVSSSVGKGATFKILLPVPLVPSLPPTAARAGVELRGGTETILLVEDDGPVRLITRRVLEQYGYTILEACTAREAREVWRNHREQIALLLSDMMMPEGVTGRDLAEELRLDRPELKIVFMSGYSAEAVRKDTEFIRRTHSRFLHKPCRSANLIQTVRQCLDEKQPEAPAR